MLRQVLESSLIRSVGYDATTGTLEVELHRGTIYRFSDVAPDVARELRASPSPGRYFNQAVRGRYLHAVVAP